MVIYGHLTERSDYLRIIIYSFHMPMFFILSGYFFDYSTSLCTTVKKCIKQFIIPAYTFLFVDYLLKCIITKQVISYSFKECLDAIVFRGGWWWNSPIWFILSLLACRIITTMFKERVICACSIISFLICLIGLNQYFPVWWASNSIICMQFFFIGILVKKFCILDYVKNIDIKVMGILSIILVVLSIYNGYTDINIHVNGKCFIIFLLTAILGSSVIIYFSYKLQNLRCGKYFDVLGRNSIYILLTHYYICRGYIPLIITKSRSFCLNVCITVALSILYYLAFIIKEKFFEKQSGMTFHKG